MLQKTLKRGQMLKGSEKQLAWANEIIDTSDKMIDNIINTIRGKNDKLIPQCEQLKAGIHAETYAGNIIDILNGLKYTGNAQEDFSQLCAKIKVCGAGKYLKGGK